MFVAVLLACCGLTYRFIEVPMQRLGRRIARRPCSCLRHQAQEIVAQLNLGEPACRKPIGAALGFERRRVILDAPGQCADQGK